MNVATARFLVSTRGRAALESVPDEVREGPPDWLVAWCRGRYATTEAAALSYQMELRKKAGDRLPSQDWLLTSAGLEMTTHRLVAERRAERALGLGLPVVDLTCGLGGDLHFLSDAPNGAMGVERDEVVACLAASNVPRAPVVVGDASRPPHRLTTAFVFIDPSRRSGVRRQFRPGDFSPAWDDAVARAEEARASCIKGPPGLPHSEVPEGSEMEVVQLGRSLRETAVWMGEGATPGLRRAVRLPEGHALDSLAPECEEEPVALGRYLLDPESCVTRAGLVRGLGGRTGSRLIDRHLGYLTVDEPVTDALAETFEVLEVVPFGVKRLKSLLRDRGWVPGEIRRRAFPVEPEEVRRLLGRSEGERVTLFLTTIAGQRTVIVGLKIEDEPGQI